MAREVSEWLGEPKRFPAERFDAGRAADIVVLACKYRVDLVLLATVKAESAAASGLP